MKTKFYNFEIFGNASLLFGDEYYKTFFFITDNVIYLSDILNSKLNIYYKYNFVLRMCNLYDHEIIRLFKGLCEITLNFYGSTKDKKREKLKNILTAYLNTGTLPQDNGIVRWGKTIIRVDTKSNCNIDVPRLLEDKLSEWLLSFIETHELIYQS